MGFSLVLLDVVVCISCVYFCCVYLIRQHPPKRLPMTSYLYKDEVGK